MKLSHLEHSKLTRRFAPRSDASSVRPRQADSKARIIVNSSNEEEISNSPTITKSTKAIHAIVSRTRSLGSSAHISPTRIYEVRTMQTLIIIPNTDTKKGQKKSTIFYKCSIYLPEIVMANGAAKTSHLLEKVLLKNIFQEFLSLQKFFLMEQVRRSEERSDELGTC